MSSTRRRSMTSWSAEAVTATVQPKRSAIPTRSVTPSRRASQPGLVRENDGLDAVAETELAEDARDVGLHRVLADNELAESAGLRMLDARPLAVARQIEGAGYLHMAVQPGLGGTYASALKIVS